MPHIAYNSTVLALTNVPVSPLPIRWGEGKGEGLLAIG